MRVICDVVKFCDGPGILHAESHIHVLTPRELPCQYIGFAPLNMAVNSVSDTVFYAIILVGYHRV